MPKETSEIAKLTERISKDPASKLFVPLAEEYKKSGDIEMAIQVLREGLGNNPDYVTARAFLGKMLLEKGEFDNAAKEFEEVIKAAPENIMALRNLANLFVLQNRPEDAIKHYKTVLALTAHDENLAALIMKLEAERQVITQPQSAPETGAGPEQVPAFAPEERPENGTPSEMTPAPVSPAPDLVEEAEDVLVVEPLDDDVEAPPIPDAAPEASAPEEPVPQGEPLGEEAAGSFFGGGEEKEEEPETGAGTVPEQADDFSTNTLAELYIAQGFHEKAIVIYQRMLAERPDNEALKEKLERVKAMAAEEASAPAGFPEAAREAGVEALPEAEQQAPTIEEEALLIGDEEIGDAGLAGAAHVEQPSAENAASAAGAGRQAAINRLETWLKAIQKRR